MSNFRRFRTYKEERQWLRGLLKEATAENDQSMASPKVQALWALLTLSEADENLSRVLSTLPNNYQRKVFIAFTHFVEKRDMARDACDRVDREDPFQDAASTVMDRPPAARPPTPEPTQRKEPKTAPVGPPPPTAVPEPIKVEPVAKAKPTVGRRPQTRGSGLLPQMPLPEHLRRRKE